MGSTALPCFNCITKLAPCICVKTINSTFYSGGTLQDNEVGASNFAQGELDMLITVCDPKAGRKPMLLDHLHF